MAGGPLGGWISDRWGRKNDLLLASVVNIVGGIIEVHYGPFYR